MRCVTYFFFCCGCLGLLLSYWQYHRAQEKDALLDQLPSSTCLSGHYLDKHAIWEQFPGTNRRYHRIFSVFEDTHQQYWWVDRGAVLALFGTAILEVPTPPNVLSLCGHPYLPQAMPFIQKAVLSQTDPTLIHVISANLSQWNQALDIDTQLFVWQLNEEAPSHFPYSMQSKAFLSPGRHQAYALQWLLLSICAFAYAYYFRSKRQSS